MSTLKQISRSLLSAARLAEERPFRRWLLGGLLLEITQMKSGDVVLMLERQDVDPGAGEWKTVLAHWPEAVPAGVVPLPRTEGRRHRLIGRWARPAAVTDGGSNNLIINSLLDPPA